MPYFNNAIGTLKNILFYKKQKSDIYHITGHIHYIALIFPRKNTVLTIHDLVILKIRKGLRRYILKKLFFDLPVKRLKYITAVSENTKKEIVFFTGCDEKKIRVIENPLQEHFYLAKKKEFNSSCPEILQIGTTDNKNLENLIKALNKIECRLRIIGEITNETIALLKKHEINYTNDTNLNDSEIRNEYESADILAFCSTYEGFGLPIIEAQAMQTPVITSNKSPLKEVSGGAAVLVNPDDYSDIGRGLMKIIKNEHLRASIVKNGLENVKRFEAKFIAGLYEKLYEEIINENF
jgi:glycosyltransferase involved in cell wall biosynthesis